MAGRVVLRVLMTLLAVVVILGTTSDDNPSVQRTHRLKLAIRIPTISTINGPEDPLKFEEFIEFINSTFPKTHNSTMVDFQVVNNYSLLYHVHGSDRTLRPFLLASHYDVVPANESNWLFPPFGGGDNDNEFVQGRGTLDGKSRIMAMLENLEDFFSSGFQPKRGFYLAFGHDDEVDGHGAKAIVELLQDRKVNLSFVMDGGIPVLSNFLNLTTIPIAIVGVAEKGFATFRMTAKGAPGHSTIPSRDTSLARLTRAVRKLEDSRFPIRFDSGFEKVMVDKLLPGDKSCFDLIFENKDLFNQTIEMLADEYPLVNALLRTTTAVTMIEGGNKSNVVPDVSTAIVSHRVYTTDTVKSVLERDEAVVDDVNVVFDTVDWSEPSKIKAGGDGYRQILTAIRFAFRGVVIVIPGLSVGGTNSKWYRRLTNVVYHISPYVATLEDLRMIHGDNEKISIDNYQRISDFYERLMTYALYS